MTLDGNVAEKINLGKFSPDVLECIAIDYAGTFRKDIVQKFYREKARISEKRFSEYLLIETTRAILRESPATFFILLNYHDELRETLNLKHLDTYEKYKDFDRKRKSLKKNIERISKRNFTRKAGGIYILDTTVGKVDMNKIRKGKKIKEMVYDAEFLHSSTEGSVVGFTVCLLINWSNLSIVKVEFYPKKAKKNQIWKEMVIDTIGSRIGKLKMVIADAGFFAYQNYMFSPHHRIIPVIKTRADLHDKVLNKIKEIPTSLLWWTQKYSRKLLTLIKDFHEIIRMTILCIKNYDKLKKIRAQIEIIFKTAKHVFGMKELHDYFIEKAYWKVYYYLYMACLLLQYLKIQNINIYRAVELLQQKSGLT